jgi:hypothetical protein
MQDKTWTTASFPTPLIFRYHLPLKGHFINPDSSNCNYIVLNSVVLHAIQATVTPPNSESEKRMRKVPSSLACKFKCFFYQGTRISKRSQHILLSLKPDLPPPLYTARLGFFLCSLLFFLICVAGRDLTKLASTGWGTDPVLTTTNNWLSYFILATWFMKKRNMMTVASAVSYFLGNSRPRYGTFKLLRSPGIDLMESIPPVYVTWRAGTTTRFRDPHIVLKFQHWVLYLSTKGLFWPFQVYIDNCWKKYSRQITGHSKVL